jgi:hypothetical protein
MAATEQRIPATSTTIHMTATETRESAKALEYLESAEMAGVTPVAYHTSPPDQCTHASQLHMRIPRSRAGNRKSHCPITEEMSSTMTSNRVRR